MKKLSLILLTPLMIAAAFAQESEGTEQKTPALELFSDEVPRYTGFAVGAHFLNQYALGDWADFATANIGAGLDAEYTLPVFLPKNIDWGISGSAEFAHVFPKADGTLKSDDQLNFSLGAWMRLPFLLAGQTFAFQPELSYGLILHHAKGQNGSTVDGRFIDSSLSLALGLRYIAPVDSLKNLEFEFAPTYTFSPEKESKSVNYLGFRLGAVWHFDRKTKVQATEEEKPPVVESPAAEAESEVLPLPLASLTVTGDRLTPDGDGMNDSVTFHPALQNADGKTDGWTLSITDPQGNPFRTIKGKGKLPESIEWDGLSDKGEAVFSKNTYGARLTVNLGREDRKRSGVKTVEASAEVKTGILLQVIVPEHEWKMVVSSMQFAGDGSTFDGLSSEILASNRETLDDVTQQIKEHPGANVFVQGYANNVSGTEKENTEELIPLSQARAEFIVEELVKRGISRSTLTAEGKGGVDPLADRNDQANWWKNRRIEFLIKK